MRFGSSYRLYKREGERKLIRLLTATGKKHLEMLKSSLHKGYWGALQKEDVCSQTQFDLPCLRVKYTAKSSLHHKNNKKKFYCIICFSI